MAFIVTWRPAATVASFPDVTVPACIATSRPAVTTASPFAIIWPWSTAVTVSRRLLALFHTTLLLLASYLTPLLITSRSAATISFPFSSVCLIVPPSFITSSLAYTVVRSRPSIVPCVLRTSVSATTVVVRPLISPLSLCIVLPCTVIASSATMLPRLCIVPTCKLIDWACIFAAPSTRCVVGAKYNIGTSKVSVLPFGNTTGWLTSITTSSVNCCCSDSVNPCPSVIDLAFITVRPASINLRYCSSSVSPACSLLLPVWRKIACITNCCS